MKINIHLNKDLRKEYGRRSFPARKGDKVKILRGSFKGSMGKIVEIRRKKGILFVDGVEREKADSSKIRAPIHASNVELIELDLSDSKRKEKVKA